ncbi:MAG: molybdenum cofactor biosynthesis protein MoaE [Lacisediminihabitans sp.]
MTEVYAKISPTPIDVAAVEDLVLSPENGALVVFRGIVRNHDSGKGVTALDYQAHPDAERFLRECCEAVAAETGLRVAAVHRTGSLLIGDVALVAAVAAPHRADAFAACSALVERIKTSVPIWKHQHYRAGNSDADSAGADSAEWVGL